MPAGQTIIRRNFIVEILTPTPRRWTPFRGTTSAGQRGLVVSSVYYATKHVEIAEFAQEDSPAPAQINVTIGNAKNDATDLVSDPTTWRAVINVTEVYFDANWIVTSTKLWFTGRLGTPQIRGKEVAIECRADLGRRGLSPSVDSATLMTSHVPPADGAAIPWGRMV
jgi:hypothetical protein